MSEAPFPETIGEQHSELRAGIRRVRAAHDAGTGWSELALLLGELDEHVKLHFATEERAMLRAAYPRYHEHRAAHEAFVDRVAALRAQCEHGGSEIMGVLVELLETWFKNHEQSADRDALEYLATR